MANQLPEEDKNKIMHVSLPVGKNSVLMETDALESTGHTLKFGDNFSISISTETKKEAEISFAKLAAGGQIKMPLQITFWGEYFGMLTDKFGIQWMMSFK